MTILSVAARLLAKAAVLPFSLVGQSLTIPAKAHRRSSATVELLAPCFLRVIGEAQTVLSGDR